MSTEDEILVDFQSEANTLLSELLEILETCEEDFSKVQELEGFGQRVDRIMGGAKSLALQYTDPDHLIHRIGDCAAICKIVGYKASQIKDQKNFYDICVALLLDATEMLEQLVAALTDSDSAKGKTLFTPAFVERLRWVSSQFGADVRASVDVNQGTNKLKQDEIDDLLKKLGF